MDLHYRNRKFKGSTARQEKGIPKNLHPGNGLDQAYWKPTDANLKSPTPVHAKDLSLKQNMHRISLVIQGSAKILGQYIKENEGDAVQGLAQYFETDAYAKNVESTGLSIEAFTVAVIARYELNNTLKSEQQSTDVANEEKS